MKHTICIMLFFQLLLSKPLIIMNNQSYPIEDIYKEYGKKEWTGANKNQQKELINDFINRRLAVIESERIGLQNKPDIAKNYMIENS